MKTFQFLIAILTLISVVPAVFATQAESLPVWETVRHDGNVDTMQLWNYSTGYDLTTTTIVNTTFATSTGGKMAQGILVSDMNNDNVPEYIVSNSTRVSVYHIINNSPVLMSSVNLGQTIVGQMYVVAGRLNAKTIVVLAAATVNAESWSGTPSAQSYQNASVYFLRYASNNGATKLFLDYELTPNDYILNLNGVVNKVGELFCKPETSADEISICAVTGTHPTTGYGRIVVFSPQHDQQSGGTYRPTYATWELQSGDNTFPYGTWQCPYGQNCNNGPAMAFYDKHHITIIPDDSMTAVGAFFPTHALYYTKTDTSRIMKIAIDDRFMFQSNGSYPMLAETSYNGVTGLAVAYNVPTFNGTVASGGSDFTYLHGAVEVFAWDFDNSGDPNFCMQRQRNTGTSATTYSYPNIETVCTDDSATLIYGAYGFGSCDKTSSPFHTSWCAIEQTSPILFDAGSINTNPTLCYTFGTGHATGISVGYSSETGKQNTAIVCTSYNGSAFVNNVSQPSYNNGTDWDSYADSYRSSIAFNPYTVFDSTPYLFTGGVLHRWDGGTFVSNATVNTSTPFSKTCVAANLAYGNTIEIGCTDGTNIGIISNNPTGFNSSEYVPPDTLNNISSDWFGGVSSYTVACSASNQTYQANRCVGNNFDQCTFNATTNMPVRIVSDCGTGTFVTGDFSVNTPSVKCPMPSGAGVLTIRFYLQDQTSKNDYSNYVDQQQTYQPDNCNEVPIGNPIYVAPTTNGTSTGPTHPTSGDVGQEANNFFSTLLGTGTNPLKIMIGLIIVIAITYMVATAEGVRQMQNSMPLIAFTAIIALVLVTFLGFLPAYILIVAVLLVILLIVGLNVIFPSGGN